MTNELLEKMEKAKTQLGEAIVSEVMNTIKEVKEEKSEVVQKQADRMAKYLGQLAKQEITKQEFAMYMEDIKALLEMEVLQLSVESKVRVLKFIELIRDMVISNLSEILKLLK